MNELIDITCVGDTYRVYLMPDKKVVRYCINCGWVEVKEPRTLQTSFYCDRCLTIQECNQRQAREAFKDITNALVADLERPGN